MAVTDSTLHDPATDAVPPLTTRGLTERMLARFVERLLANGSLPAHVVRNVTVSTLPFFRRGAGRVRTEPTRAQIENLGQAAANWSRSGVPLDAVLAALHAGFDAGVAVVAETPRHWAAPGECGRVREDLEPIMAMLALATSTTTMAYLHEARVRSDVRRASGSDLATALLAGRFTSKIARECGIEIAPAYIVVATHIPAHPHDGDGAAVAEATARHRLLRLESELARRCEGAALTVLSGTGGTILLPAGSLAEEDLDDLISALARACGVPVVATSEFATIAELPGTADHVHQLLDVAVRLGFAGGHYRVDSLALEAQLSKPGPARDSIAAKLDPLRAHPDLLELLSVHLNNDLNRRRTARIFHVHANTIDNRLKRIAQLTGLDPTCADGAWLLQSALVAGGYRSNSITRHRVSAKSPPGQNHSVGTAPLGLLPPTGTGSTV